MKRLHRCSGTACIAVLLQIALPVPHVLAATIFQDNFNVGSDIDLVNRTPDPGTGWTQIRMQTTKYLSPVVIAHRDPVGSQYAYKRSSL